MKTTFAVLAVLVVCSYAAPAPAEKALKKADQEMITPIKGDAPMEKQHTVTKGEQNDVEEATGEVWIPFWDFFSSFFSKKETPKTEMTLGATNEINEVKPSPCECETCKRCERCRRGDRCERCNGCNRPEPRKIPVRDHYEDSGEFLQELNTFHFGESEEEQQLVDVDSDEIRRSPHKAPEHVKDAILYNKVLPKREDFSDYGDFLEATNNHLMGSPVMAKKAEPKVKSSWNSWFGKR